MSSTPPNKYFCPRPFDHVFGEGGQSWKLCCRCSENKHFQDYTLDEFSPEEWFFSDIMESIRLWMINGEDPHGIIKESCALCHNLEKNNIQSDRIYRWNLYKNFDNLHESLGKFKAGNSWQNSLTGRVIDLKIQVIGDYCNLSCFACQPKNSSTRRNELRKLGLDSEEFPWAWRGFVKDVELYSKVDNLLPHTRQIFFQGGEPLLTKDHLKILEKVMGTDIRIQYATNLTRLSDEVIDTWKQMHSVKLNVSIDGYGKEAEYNRYGLKWSTFVDNIKRLESNFEVELCYTTSVVNIMNIRKHYEEFSNDPLFKEFNFNSYSNIVTSPNFLSIYTLPKELKEIAYNKIKDIKALEQVANMLRSDKDHSFLFPKAMKYIKTLDKARGANILDYSPEYSEY